MTGVFTSWLLPPLNALLLLIAGFLVQRWRPRVALWLLIAGTALLWICSTPFLAERTLRALEVAPPAAPLTGTGAGAIVILGGGAYVSAPEYGVDTVGRMTLERLRYGARLHRQTSLPVLVTGGATAGARSSEAEQMRDVLEQDFATPVQWVEPLAMDTLASAVTSEKLLREQGVTRILLVTHAVHMRRARMAFEHAGLQVVPAPMGFTTHAQGTLFELGLPSARGIWMTRTAWHEALGWAWYRLRFAFS